MIRVRVSVLVQVKLLNPDRTTAIWLWCNLCPFCIRYYTKIAKVRAFLAKFMAQSVKAMEIFVPVRNNKNNN